ncbi:hypothetical protein ONE63_009885 [Megalurothrips usitatus]|uniref:SESTD1-like spectrin repeats region domain-containing protein n=1 Tax=Megalurothrips usitatus TaxID=439358 RepID=A0AAV7XKS6_9NEOP|nr:hypothetical protein ONE63_009885 [Megalurothrips usitatus]
MEAADILGALQARVALVPGCRDLGERPVLLVPVPAENAPWTKERLDLVLRYFASIYSPETRRAGLTVVVDARSGPWRSARVAVRQVGASLGPDLALLLVLRPAAFWDKQRVDSCARAQRQREPILIPLSRLHKYVAAHQIPEELGGPWVHNHHQWIQNRIYMEAFAREAETAANDLDKLRGRLAGQQAMLSGESAATTNPTTIGAITISARINLEQPPVTLENYQQTKEMARQVVTAGRELLERLDKDYSALTSPQVQLAVQQPVPQDVVDTRTRIERLLELLAAKQALLHDGWHNLQSTLVDAKELSALEDRVSQVTDWILGPAETMLNAQREVGLDVASAEELREAHESLELQCRDTYGRYAELLHRLDSRPAAGLPLPADLRSQRDFMDFACRSFATRLERRRTVLISSLRFYRLVDEYLETTADILEALMREGDVEALESVDEALRQLQRHQVDVDELERLVVRQGEKLSDLLSMPVKDALGREVSVDYEAHIGHVAALLEAVRARQALFSDSVTVRRLTLQQAGHVRAYEQDAAQAVRWLGELLRALLGSHAHVGCTPQEIQQQKAEQQALQETARTAHQYGAQLLALARSLRVSCRLTLGQHRVLADQLDGAWEALHAVSQEQMTRLRVSAVFHRSVQEHCKQLRELAAAVPSLAAEPDQSRRRSRLRKFLGSRERLLLEVGRMVRLGRLLRSRLREPLADPVPTASSTASPTAPLAGSPLGAPPPGPLCRLQSPLPSPVTVPGAAAAGINRCVSAAPLLYF